VATNQFKREDVYLDIIGLIGAGMDTTSTAVASTLFLLKKYPETLDKLITEMNESGMDILKKPSQSNGNPESEIMTEQDFSGISEKLQSCEYLTD
jgi:cytochrome P450